MQARHWNLMDCPTCGERVNVYVDKDGVVGPLMEPTAVNQHRCDLTKPSRQTVKNLVAFYNRGEL